MTSTTVAILTYNRARDLERCLSALARQTRRPFEVLVVDNGSTDGTRDVLRRFAVRSLYSEIHNKGYLRNLAWRDARGNVIAYLDDDAEPAADWLEALEETFRDYPDCGGAGGPTIVRQGQELLTLFDARRGRLLSRAAGAAYNALVMGGALWDIGRYLDSGAYSIGGSLEGSSAGEAPYPVDILSTCNGAVRRSILQELGGFDENFLYNHEDGDLFLRVRQAGHRLYFHPRAVVLHHPNPDPKTRATPYLMGRDFGYFYSKHARPTGLRDRGRYLLNVSFFLGFWLYKTVQHRKPEYLRGIGAFFAGYRLRRRGPARA